MSVHNFLTWVYDLQRPKPASMLEVCLRSLVTTVALIAVVGCGSHDSPPMGPLNWRTTPTVIQLQSDPGDYIGAGKSYEYTKADAIITVGDTGGRFSLEVTGDEHWSADFVLPSANTSLQPGTYTGLTRYPFSDPAKGGLDWSGEGRGCNTLTGSMTIDTAKYDGSTLTALDLRFEQHCEGNTIALHGTIHWSLADRTRPSGPVYPIPTDLWKPDVGSTPPNGNYVYLKSDPGDWVGTGQTLTYTATTAVSLKINGRLLTISVDGWGWSGDFQAMNTLISLRPGYYGGLRRYQFNNPVKGGLDWFGEGNGCDTLTGWFAIDAITIAGDTPTMLDLRFEQHCEGATPALRGAIHWVQ